jgi:hypothetical protein
MAGPAQVTIEVTTQAQSMENGSWPPANPPQITLDGDPIPTASGPLNIPAGFQVVIFDPTVDITQPSAILSNEYQEMVLDNTDLWGNTYQYMYDHIIKQLITTGDPQEQLVVLASFGLDYNAPPTTELVELLEARGSGKALQQWILDSDTGSQGGDFLCGNPVDYVLIGNSEYSFGEGTEQLDGGTGQPVQTQVSFVYDNPQPPPS